MLGLRHSLREELALFMVPSFPRATKESHYLEKGQELSYRLVSEWKESWANGEEVGGKEEGQRKFHKIPSVLLVHTETSQQPEKQAQSNTKGKQN